MIPVVDDYVSLWPWQAKALCHLGLITDEQVEWTALQSEHEVAHRAYLDAQAQEAWNALSRRERMKNNFLVWGMRWKQENDPWETHE